MVGIFRIKTLKHSPQNCTFNIFKQNAKKRIRTSKFNEIYFCGQVSAYRVVLAPRQDQ